MTPLTFNNFLTHYCTGPLSKDLSNRDKIICLIASGALLVFGQGNCMKKFLNSACAKACAKF